MGLLACRPFFHLFVHSFGKHVQTVFMCQALHPLDSLGGCKTVLESPERWPG